MAKIDLLTDYCKKVKLVICYQDVHNAVCTVDYGVLVPD